MNWVQNLMQDLEDLDDSNPSQEYTRVDHLIDDEEGIRAAREFRDNPENQIKVQQYINEAYQSKAVQDGRRNFDLKIKALEEVKKAKAQKVAGAWLKKIADQDEVMDPDHEESKEEVKSGMREITKDGITLTKEGKNVWKIAKEWYPTQN